MKTASLGGGTRRRMLFVVTEDWAFLSNRLPMARAARAAGWEVHVATRVTDRGEAIAGEGFTLHPIEWRRRTLSPVAILREAARLRKIYRRESFDLIHHVAVKPVFVGSIASIGFDTPIANSIDGLGYAFTSRHWRARLVGSVLALSLRHFLNRRSNITIVQNPDDYAVLVGIGVRPERINVIPGTGIDVEVLHPTPEPAGPIRAAYVGRMLEDKGVRSLIAAHRILRDRGVPLALDLAGTPDPGNPTSIPTSELEAWNSEPGITWLGQVKDIPGLWSRSHIAVLPSRREGLPNSLLEAAACGRPIVATDVPGCREVARQGQNALLVPPDDAPALADALQRLAGDADLRRRYGAAGRALVEKGYSDREIGALTVALYEKLSAVPSLASGGAAL